MGKFFRVHRNYYIFLLWVYLSITNTCNASNSQPTIRVGSELEFPPFAFVDENGQPAGFSVDLIKSVANTMGLPIIITTGKWDAMWNGLVSGNIDVLPIVAKLPERLKLVDFSLTHTETFDAFFVRKGEPDIDNIEAAQGKNLVVMKSDAAHHALLEQKFQGEVILSDTIPDGLSIVASGKFDAFLCSKLIGTLAIEKHSIKGLKAGHIIPNYKRNFSFGIKKGNDELKEKLNQGLLIIKSNGEYNRIYEKWIRYEDDIWLIYRKYFLFTIIGFGIFGLIIVFWVSILRTQVKKRTIEISRKNELLTHEIKIRKQAEEELYSHKKNLENLIKERTKVLQQSQEAFKSYFNMMTVGMAVTSIEKDWIEVNQRLCDMLGYSKEELYKRSWTDMTYPDDLELDINLFNQVVSGERDGYELDKRFIRKDGSIIYTRICVACQRNIDGSVYHFLASLLDITYRKQSEDALRDSELKYRTLFDNSGTSILIIDSDGVYQLMNKAAAASFGGTPDDFIGKSIFDLLPHQVAKDYLLSNSHIIETGIGRIYERTFDLPTGEKTFLINDQAIKDTLGRGVTLQSSSIDITKQKQVEENIKTSLLEKEILLKEIHHRVKNNLQIISSLLKLQTRNIEDEKTEGILKECQERIMAMALVHSLLYKTKNLADIDFGEYAREIANQLFRSYKTSVSAISLVTHTENVRLSIDLAIPCGLIINELITNALKYAFGGIRNGEINIEIKQTENGIRLLFKDNGIGFPKTLDFYNTKTFGLKLVHMLVKQLDGSIEQFVNGGTRYVIIFSPQPLKTKEI